MQKQADCEIVEFEFVRWIHRARFQENAEPIKEGMYGFVRVGAKFPYVLSFFLPGSRFLKKARRLLDVIPGAERPAVDPEKRIQTYRRLLKENNFVYLGGADLLRRHLKAAPELEKWDRVYCPMCADKSCRRGSTQIFRCNQIAEYIGALDEVEIVDIYNLYADCGRSLYDRFLKIAESECVGDILRVARPRWPDAF